MSFPTARLSNAPNGRVGLALLVLFGAGASTIWIMGLPEGAGTSGFALRAMGLFAIQLAAIDVVWRRSGPATLWVLLGFAIVFRLVALSWAPDLSSDLYRYVWDGRVQMSGESPYAAPPGDPSLSELRDDEIWPRINRHEAVTVYPPGAQVAFLTLAVVGADSTNAVKAAASAVEMVVLGLLVLAWRRTLLTCRGFAIYAWSPLVVSEVCVSGHIDALVLPLCVGGILLAGTRRKALGGLLVGAAALLKIYPALLLAAFPRGGRKSAVAAAVGLAALLYSVYIAWSGSAVLGFLPKYVGVAEDFNIGVRRWVESGLGLFLANPRPAAIILCLGAMCAAVVAIARTGEDVFWKARSIALAFMLLLPTAVHPWYAVWLVPFLAFRPSPAGVWLVGILPLSYLKYGAPGGVMPNWIPIVEWLPTFALLGLAWWWSRRKKSEET